MVVPWIEESDRPRAGRHQWAMSCAVRLAAAYRLGCIAEDDLKASLEHLEKALEHWCLQAGVPRELHHDEVGSAFRWAVTKVASFTDEQTRGELRDHSHTADITSDCAGDLEQAVASEIHRLRVREEAHKRFTAEKAGPASSFDAGLLDEILARPMQEQFVIEGLLPSAGSMLVVAQRKAGKTTLMLNMARSLLTGEPFLGTFWACKVSGRVAILNYEVSGGQLSRWAAEVGIPGDRLLVVNLRGQRNPLTHSADRAALAELLRQHGAEVVIVDPFSGAYTGSSQNDSGEVGAWLMDLDRFARNEAGARELILTAHAGWGNQGRVRGSSALEDWADSIVTLTLDTDNKSRYLRAIGRDVAVDEDRLSYDEDTRLLSFTGSGSRKQAQGRDKAEALMASVCEFVRANPGAAVSNIQTHLQALRRADQIPIAFQTQDVRNAITKAEEMGQLCRDTGGPGSRPSTM
ncbi:hypothetical protein MAUB_47840 [Mycolicibacterium aubagnense]|uniref:AAA domain-containing protein n=2 Tax=Mycolicibacterium aubagnense TaxID=319707 RepID=A0ABM7IJI2_9MYCO|nr:hypothetical protein MAUB_47840 [Mycolicibacterium aubagnense]